MTDFTPYQNLDFAFATLPASLSKTWAAREIANVRDIASHAEYGDALENLVAITQQTGNEFSADQVSQISEMSRSMGMGSAPFFKKRYGKPRPPSPAVAV